MSTPLPPFNFISDRNGYAHYRFDSAMDDEDISNSFVEATSGSDKTLLKLMKGSTWLSSDNMFDQGASHATSSDTGAIAQRFIRPPASNPTLNKGQLILGRTLISLLDTACGRTPNVQALNQWRNHQWEPLSNQALRQEAEEIALGLLALGVNKGDRIPLVMPNSLDFCRVDMGCLLSGLVDVPIDLTQTIENILFILRHCQAKVMVISNLNLLQQLVPYLWEASALEHIVVSEVPVDWPAIRATLTRQTQQPTSIAQREHLEKTTVKVAPSPGSCLQIPQLLGAACTQAPCPPLLCHPAFSSRPSMKYDNRVASIGQ